MANRLKLFCEQVVVFCVYGLVFFTPISIAAANIFSWAGILFFITLEVIRSDFAKYRKPVFYFLAAFFLFNCLSLFNSQEHIRTSLIALFLKWLKYILIFVFVQDVINTKERFRAVWIILLFSVGLIAFDGIWQKIFAVDFLRHKDLVLLDSRVLSGVTGPFSHYNNFGAYLMIALSICIGFILKKKSSIISVYYSYIIFTLSGLCLLFTYSRGSWLSFIFVLVFMAIITKRYKVIIYLSTVLIVLFFFLPGIQQRKIFMFKPASAQEQSKSDFKLRDSVVVYDADRFKIWGATLAMIKDDPLIGKGVGTFMSRFEKYRPDLQVQYAHNCFLQIWAESGLFSLISFILFIVVVLFKGIKSFRKYGNIMLVSLVAGILGFMVHSFFDTDLYSLQLAIMFWMFMGLIYSLSLAEERIFS